MGGPLTGIRILEIGHMLAGPYCGLLLADLGADVIKIEPREGDIARTVSPRSLGPHNEYFASLNRSKRSVVIDLASSAGQQSLHALVRTARGLITNLRPAAVKKLGLTYEALRAVNSGICCVALTGFGLNGLNADRPAYDYIIQAMTGVMSITGEPDSPPTKTGYSAVDNAAGIMAAFALAAKLVEGKGGQVDVAMYDVMLSQLNYIAAATLNADVTAQRYARSAHPYLVPAQVFETRKGWLILFISHDRFWQLFCNEVGCPQWTVDPRFATMAARQANRDAVVKAVEELLMTEDAETWVRRLIPLGIVAAEVSTLEAALSSDLTAERDMVIDIATAAGMLRSVGNPIKTGSQVDHRPPPLLGEHTQALLGENS